MEKRLMQQQDDEYLTHRFWIRTDRQTKRAREIHRRTGSEWERQTKTQHTDGFKDRRGPEFLITSTFPVYHRPKTMMANILLITSTLFEIDRIALYSILEEGKKRKERDRQIDRQIQTDIDQDLIRLSILISFYCMTHLPYMCICPQHRLTPVFPTKLPFFPFVTPHYSRPTEPDHINPVQWGGQTRGHYGNPKIMDTLDWLSEAGPDILWSVSSRDGKNSWHKISRRDDNVSLF